MLVILNNATQPNLTIQTQYICTRFINSKLHATFVSCGIYKRLDSLVEVKK